MTNGKVAMNEKEVLYKLTSTFKYAFKGESKEAGFITLKAPIMKQHREAAQLKQSIMTLVRTEYTDNSETNSNDKKINEPTEEDDITAELILTLMFCSKNIDINVIFEQAKLLFKSGVALIDGEQILSHVLVDKMSIDDFQNLTGEYIANFILA